jgi:hypothetical protein
MRDLRKDLELCKKAQEEYRQICRLETSGYFIPLQPGSVLTKFFWEALESWPETIKRALAAEDRGKELETTLKIMEKQLEIAAKEITNINSEFDTCPSEYDRELTCTCNSTIADVYRCWRERWKQKTLAELEGDKDERA